MEHSQNGFATEVAIVDVPDATLPRPPATPSNLPVAVPGEEPPPTLIDFSPVEVRYRSDGWTREKQRAFIEELADCGIVREAAARVGMTEQSANRLRRRADAAAFNCAWAAAIRIGADRLHSVAWERAVLGVARPRFYRGEKIGEERVYDGRLLTWLLGKSEPLVDVCSSGKAARDWDRWMEAIEDGLAAPQLRPEETSRSPVWLDDEGCWWTNFPPPPEFDSDCVGRYGDEGYRRVCTLEERTALDAARAREEQENSRRRDLYFARMK